ncbi:MAG TPA: hypothetical protein VM308_07390 [Sphingomicrobium sp.]|nr:hypothetical protein [Sphingomicrobium sp.]
MIEFDPRTLLAIAFACLVAGTVLMMSNHFASYVRRSVSLGSFFCFALAVLAIGAASLSGNWTVDGRAHESQGLAGRVLVAKSAASMNLREGAGGQLSDSSGRAAMPDLDSGPIG